MNVDFIIALGYIVPMFDEGFGHIQSKSVAQTQRCKSVVLPQEAQVVITVVEHRDFTLVNKGPNQQAGDTVVALAAIRRTGKMGGCF